ncbi:hypothetical protein [Acinetobacter equi]|uniref:Uncharacterized protein n=1 Tax=Acinetobacter equi TaxID=1324350 RepID=A0A0N9W0A9_9GAMM|nr:hypothetical protein [Acinetobacter equi]ALH94438.1 hypothetical protein AOY20_02140 [Acinetobacter equi]
MQNNKYSTDIDEPLTEIQLDEFHVVIGTETNLPELAYLPKRTIFLKTRNHHDLKTGFPENNYNGEWGHGFFYITKNQEVYSFFSFGPAGDGSSITGRFSTCDYSITEVAHLYRLRISRKEAEDIANSVKDIRKKSRSYIYNEETDEFELNETINSEKKKYRVLTNETCAKEAEKILKKHLGKKIPNGKGYIKFDILSIPAVNPYSWWEKLEKSTLDKYKYPEYPKLGRAEIKLGQVSKDDSNEFIHRLYGPSLTDFYDPDTIIWRTGENATEIEYWTLLEGDVDPLIEWGYLENDL